MNIYVLLNDEQKGPYTIGQLRSMWNSGTLTSATLHRQESSSEWQPLAALIHQLEPQASSSQVPPAPQPSPEPPRLPIDSPQEKLLYKDYAFRITKSVVVVNGTTYALRNINSVRAVKKGIGFFSGALAGLAILYGVSLLVSGDAFKLVFGLLLIATMGCGIYFLSRQCVLTFDTSSGAVTGFESRNYAYVKQMADKIAEAMSGRE